MNDALDTISKVGFFGSLAAFVVGVLMMRCSGPVMGSGARLFMEGFPRIGVSVMQCSRPAWRWGCRLMQAGLIGLVLTFAALFVLYQSQQSVIVLANHRMTTWQGADLFPLVRVGCMVVAIALLLIYLVGEKFALVRCISQQTLWVNLVLLVLVWWGGTFVWPPGWIFYIANSSHTGNATVLDTGSGSELMALPADAIGVLVWRRQPPSGLRVLFRFSAFCCPG